MLGQVLGARVLHVSKAGKIGSKFGVSVDGAQKFIYFNKAVGESISEVDSLTVGQVVALEKDGNFFRLAKDQSSAKGLVYLNKQPLMYLYKVNKLNKCLKVRNYLINQR